MSFEIHDIPNKSILVLSSYRCGSTALCSFLEKKYGIVNYEEAFHAKVSLLPREKPFPEPAKISPRFEHFKSSCRNNRFVVKVVPNQLWPHEKEVFFNELFKDCYTIKLTRKDVFDQTLSYFIAASVQKWNYKTNEERPDYNINIRFDFLDWCIQYIKRINSSVESYECDKSLCYEELGFLKCDIQEYKKPTNYLELIAALRDRLGVQV